MYSREEWNVSVKRQRRLYKRLEHRLGLLAFRMHIWWRKSLSIPFSEERMKRLQMISPGSLPGELEKREDCRRFILWIRIVLLTIALSFLAWAGEFGTGLLKGSGYLERQEPGKGERKAELKVKGEGVQKEVQIVIPEREYLPEELQAKMEQGRRYIIEKYLGDNKSAEKVTKPLQLVSHIEDSAIKVKWKLDSTGYINRDGTLNNGSLHQKTEVSVTAYMVYKENREPVELELILYPAKKSREQRFWEEWESLLDREKKRSAGQEVLTLPRKVAGDNVFYREIHRRSWCRVLLLGLP